MYTIANPGLSSAIASAGHHVAVPFGNDIAGASGHHDMCPPSTILHPVLKAAALFLHS